MRKKKLSAIPRRKVPAPPQEGTSPATDDRSYIVEALRPLAVPIGDLQFDPRNPRTHDDKNLDAIRGSLRAYGQRRPLVVNRRTGTVEAGNGTLQAALSLGWSWIAAVYVDDDASVAAGYSIADNRTAELAGWDKEALDQILHEISTNNDERLDRMIAELTKDLGLYQSGEDQKKIDPEEATSLKKKFSLVVELTDEAQQEALYERLTQEGYRCRVLIL